MNTTLSQLEERKSVRAFEDRPIPEEVRTQILQGAVQAPTAGNQQLYTILDITSQEIKEKLAILCDNQGFIGRAPLVLVFCADCKKWYDAYQSVGCSPRKPGLGDLLLAVSDTNIAAQNAVTAAWSLGVGSCYIGDVMEQRKDMVALLHLPEFVFPAAMVVFGYPTAQQLRRPKPKRQPMAQIVHENAYHTMNPAELEEMLSEKSGERSYQDWLTAFCQRKYNSEFSREMTRSVAEYLEEYDKNPSPRP